MCIFIQMRPVILLLALAGASYARHWLEEITSRHRVTIQQQNYYPLYLHKRSFDNGQVRTRQQYNNTHIPEASFSIRNDRNQIARIELELNHHLLHPKFQFLGGDRESTFVENCYYHGRISGINDSFVAVHTCKNSLEGVLYLGDRKLEISAGGTRLKKRQGANIHVVRAAEQGPDRYGSCGNSNDDHLPLNIAPPPGYGSVHKRADGDVKYIELLLCNDFARVSQYGSLVEQNTLQLANIASGRYLQTFDRKVIVTVIGVFSAPRQLWKPNDIQTTDAQGLLDDFTDWRRAQLAGTFSSAAALRDNDVAILLTGRDLTNRGSSSIVGLSNVAKICKDDSAGISEGKLTGSQLAVQGNTLAHELAHVLNVPHDGSADAESCPSSGSIMQAVSCSNCAQEVNTQFSPCSKFILQRFIHGSSASCLNNVPEDPHFCGNGVVDIAQGEECDSGPNGDDSCCDRKTCKFRISGTKCFANARDLRKRLAGICSNSGTCVATCGNGRLDSNEACDPTASANDCCDRQSCTFKTQGTVCAKGKCDVGGVCKSNALPVLPRAVLRVDTKEPQNSYRISIDKTEAQRSVMAVYSLDGSIPYPNATSSFPYLSPFDLTLERILELGKNQTRMSTWERQPIPSGDGRIRLLLSVKTFHPDFISSQVVNKTLDFKMQSSSALGQADDGSSGSNVVGISFASACGAMAVVVVVFAIVYKTRHMDTKQRWKSKAKLRYNSMKDSVVNTTQILMGTRFGMLVRKSPLVVDDGLRQYANNNEMDAMPCPDESHRQSVDITDLHRRRHSFIPSYYFQDAELERPVSSASLPGCTDCVFMLNMELPGPISK